MKTYIALLRGINVSGHNIIKMADLKFMLEEMNYKNVRTYLQSGNVVFGCDESSDVKLAEKIKTNIEKTFGLSVPNCFKECTGPRKDNSGKSFH